MESKKLQTYAKKIQKMYFDDLRLCGCGSPEHRIIFIKLLLNLINDRFEKEMTYDEYYKKLIELFGFKENKESKRYLNNIQDGIIECILDQFNEAGLLVHGGTIGGSWLSDYGEEMLEILNDINEEDINLYLEYSF